MSFGRGGRDDAMMYARQLRRVEQPVRQAAQRRVDLVQNVGQVFLLDVQVVGACPIPLTD